MTAIGGATRNTIFMQAMANAFGKTLHVKPNADYLAAVGVARLAARVLGWSEAEMHLGARGNPGYQERIVVPDPLRAAFLHRRFKHFQHVAATVTSFPVEDALE